ncbi:MAG: hypothetical protein SGILL_004348 [Bacillariaceae sp.]
MVEFDVPVEIRRPKDQGGGEYRCITVTIQSGEKQPSQLVQLKHSVIDIFQLDWNDTGLTLRPEHIIVFVIDRNGKHLAGDDLQPWGTVEPDGAFHEEKKEDFPRKFLAQEILGGVPEDLLRTALVEQLEGVTFLDPQRSSQWTSIAPLFLAGLTGKEFVDPWWSKVGDDYKTPHGPSFFARNDTEEEIVLREGEKYDPLQDPIRKGETTGTKRMSFPQYEGCLESLDEDVAHFGALLGDMICNGPGGQRKAGFVQLSEEERKIEEKARAKAKKEEKKARIRAEQEAKQGGKNETKQDEKKRDKLATRLRTFIRFLLAKGIKLADLGVAIVFDHLVEGQRHYTLVLLNSGTYHKWAFCLKHNVFLPIEYHSRFNDNQEDIDELKEEIFKPTSNEPHIVRHGGHWCLPKVAAQMVPENFKLEAAAEPVELEEFPDHDKGPKIYLAARVLFYSTLDWQVLLAIQAVVDVDYVLESLDPVSRRVLAATIGGSLDPKEAAERLAISESDADEALWYLLELLEDENDVHDAENDQGAPESDLLANRDDFLAAPSPEEGPSDPVSSPPVKEILCECEGKDGKSLSPLSTTAPSKDKDTSDVRSTPPVKEIPEKEIQCDEKEETDSSVLSSQSSQTQADSFTTPAKQRIFRFEMTEVDNALPSLAETD